MMCSRKALLRLAKTKMFLSAVQFCGTHKVSGTYTEICQGERVDHFAVDCTSCYKRGFPYDCWHPWKHLWHSSSNDRWQCGLAAVRKNFDSGAWAVLNALIEWLWKEAFWLCSWCSSSSSSTYKHLLVMLVCASSTRSVLYPKVVCMYSGPGSGFIKIVKLQFNKEQSMLYKITRFLGSVNCFFLFLFLHLQTFCLTFCIFFLVKLKQVLHTILYSALICSVLSLKLVMP